ncbi:NU1M oxidoreductase, partial [Acromyrmex charruanus]
VLVRVAFLTLLERKILGGLLQSFRDAIKLFSREVFIVYKSNYNIIYIIFVLLFYLGYITNIYYLNYLLLVLIIILTIIGYVYIYGMLSYEVSLIMIFLILMILRERCTFIDFLKYGVIIMPLFLVFLLRIIAKLNRRPINFVEGESELVSGFNVKYFRGRFALIFMAEYGMIIFFMLSISFPLLVYIFNMYHVEAPVYGSIVLTGGGGVLLKSTYLIFRFGIGRIILRILCLVQIDIKSIVAYSSVVHMNLMLCRLMTLFKVGVIGGYVMIISHGLCSSILNLYYEQRLLFLNKGLINNLPTVIIWWFSNNFFLQQNCDK